MIIIPLLLLLIRATHEIRLQSGGVYKRDDAPGSSFRCFSCMSRYYGATWKFVGYNRIYMEPRSFTDDCQDPTGRGSDVPYTICPDKANCVTLVEDIRLGVGAKGYIRGCWSNIFIYGFNRTGYPGALSSHQFCRPFNLSSLVAGGRPLDAQMQVCSCAGNLCNAGTVNSSLSYSSLFIYLFPLILIILNL
ncbi:hot-9 [Pristionchus pacificus]|uniref:Hot-9 n=1 Tax=Pristionchus pacificus TaxID=54126 RepID=A0A2A6C2V2_PRIPA|nr:hot-9 [Pristionchus pacificus]|eukprot:PDM72427.1 hot-9 [Pristionchus pacificus]